MPEVAYIALGSNLGARAALLASARNAMSLLRGTTLLAATRVSETVPFGTGPQGPYLNQMVALRTTLPPVVLLAELHRIERSLGRVRRVRWGARTIDLDIVSMGDLRIARPELVLPHPALTTRAFWREAVHELEPLTRRVAA